MVGLQIAPKIVKYLGIHHHLDAASQVLKVDHGHRSVLPRLNTPDSLDRTNDSDARAGRPGGPSRYFGVPVGKTHSDRILEWMGTQVDADRFLLVGEKF